MKNLINTSKNSGVEKIKRIAYAFQVLVVGVAIPVLFTLGISNDTVKNTVPVENKNSISNDAHSAPAETIQFHIPQI